MAVLQLNSIFVKKNREAYVFSFTTIRRLGILDEQLNHWRQVYHSEYLCRAFIEPQ